MKLRVGPPHCVHVEPGTAASPSAARCARVALSAETTARESSTRLTIIVPLDTNLTPPAGPVVGLLRQTVLARLLCRRDIVHADCATSMRFNFFHWRWGPTPSAY